MSTGNTAVSQRVNYTPSSFTEFLWWLATAEKEILADSVIDRNRYRIIGMSVLGTWIFATLTWTYFFSTMISSPVIFLLLGLFMGFIILTIDRALIKGITRFNKRKVLPLFFRAVLALTIGTFMAQPAVLYMFDKEIKVQTSLDNEKKKQLKRHELDTLYKNRKDELLAEKNSLQKEIADKYDASAKARESFIAETDGTGGSGKIGLKEIATAKRNEYLKLDEAYQQSVKENKPKLDSLETGLAGLESEKKKAESEFNQYLNNGFLTRIEALNNILKDNSTLQFRYYLIVFILMLIELMPVIAKTLLPSGSYDEKVMLREEMEIDIAHINIKQEQQLKELYNRLSYENNAETIRSFFASTKDDREEKIKSFSKRWKDENNQSFDSMWEKMKKDVLSKQEN